MMTSDIMLSYHWQEHKLVRKIKEYLSKAGFSVWMNTDVVGANLNEQIAEAVDGVKLVILCISEHYETSAICKKEYTYVDKIQKPFIPVYVQNNFRATRGKVLDFNIGDTLYYNLYNEERFTEVISHVIFAIKKMLNHEGIFSYLFIG